MRSVATPKVGNEEEGEEKEATDSEGEEEGLHVIEEEGVLGEESC